MRRSTLLLCTAAALALLPAAASAQTRTGDHEMGFSAAFTDVEEGMLDLSFRYGHYLTRNLELGVELSGQGELDELHESFQGQAFALWDLNPGESVVWYTRAGYFAFFDAPGDGYLHGAVGFKSYLRDDFAFFTEAGYGIAFVGDADGGVTRAVSGLVCTF